MTKKNKLYWFQSALSGFYDNKITNFNIKEFSKPFLVAEIGSNFNGSMELAEKMIFITKECVDAVKFQSCNKDTILQEKIWKNSPSPIPEFIKKSRRI